MEFYTNRLAVVFGVLVVQWLTFGSRELVTNSDQPPSASNLAHSQMEYTGSRAMPQSLNTYTKESTQFSRCDISFITRPEDLNT